jgi:hypothetical protein
MREFRQDIVKIQQYCSFLRRGKVRLMGVNNQVMGGICPFACVYLYYILGFWFCTLVLATQ